MISKILTQSAFSYTHNSLLALKDLSDKDVLELEEIERIKQKWDRRDEFV